MDDLLMKAATVVAVALAAFSSFPSPAQQDNGSNQNPTVVRKAATSPMQMLAMLQEPASPVQSQTPMQPQTTSPMQTEPAQQQSAQQQAQPGQEQQQPRVKTVQLQLITGELVNKLDSKAAKQGDSVILKTREDVKTPDGTDIPKGSKLVGHVTTVQSRGDGSENSQITLQFDRAELKGGQAVPIASVIESVAPSTGEGTMANNNGVTAMPASPGASNAPVTGSGVANPTNNNGLNQNTDNHPGVAAGTTSETLEQQQREMNGASSNSQGPGSIVARNGNIAIRTTSIPGILIANNVSGQPFSNASGVLLGARRDIELDGGTQMVVAVATVPQGPGSGMTR
jgi:hypothetical protein